MSPTYKGTATIDETGNFAFTPDPHNPGGNPGGELPEVGNPPSGGFSWDVSKLDSSMDEHPRPTNGKPAYLEPMTDPVFRTKVTRISGDPGSPIGELGERWPDIVSHHYSKDQAWNANQSLIYLDTPGVFLDGSTYEPRFLVGHIPSNSDVRWHASDPDLMVYAADGVLGTWNVRTDEREVIDEFAGYTNLKIGPWEGNLSYDGNVIALQGQRGAENAAFTYNMETGVKGPDIAAGLGFDWVSISPKGTSLVWTIQDGEVAVADLDGNVQRQTPLNRISHFDLAVDLNGDEVMVGRKNDGGGHILSIRLSDLREIELTKGGYGQHTGARALGSGYCVADWQDNRPNHQPYQGEVGLIALDGSAVYRLCHHHNAVQPDYKSETHASMSPDGGRVIFVSTWDVAGAEPRPAQVYVVDIR